MQEGSYQFVDDLGGVSKIQTLLYATSHHCIVLGLARPVSSNIRHLEIGFWDLALATNITFQKLLGEYYRKLCCRTFVIFLTINSQCYDID